jgi:hypothetical protein
MRKLILALFFLTIPLHAEKLEEMLWVLEQQYNSDEPDLEIVREQVGALNRLIAQRTYLFKNKARWWVHPKDDLVLELENIANILAPHEEMLIGFAYYEGMQQGHASTLTTLLNARPTDTLKASLGNYLFGDYSKQVPARSLMVLHELHLADDKLYERLFEQIASEKFRTGNFYTLRLFSSRKDPVEGFNNALLELMEKQSSKYTTDQLDDIIELSVLAMAYSDMIDGMGSRMTVLASRLKGLLSKILNSPHRDEVFAIYPNLDEHINSIIRRVEQDQRRVIPPLGYGLVIDSNNSSSAEQTLEIEETIEVSVMPKSANEESAEIEPVKVTEETTQESSQWWLWLVGALVVFGGLVVVVRRKS